MVFSSVTSAYSPIPTPGLRCFLRLERDDQLRVQGLCYLLERREAGKTMGQAFDPRDRGLRHAGLLRHVYLGHFLFEPLIDDAPRKLVLRPQLLIFRPNRLILQEFFSVLLVIHNHHPFRVKKSFILLSAISISSWGVLISSFYAVRLIRLFQVLF